MGAASDLVGRDLVACELGLAGSVYDSLIHAIRQWPSRPIAVHALSEMGEGFVAGLSRRGGWDVEA